MFFFVSCPSGEKKKMHNSEFWVIIITHKKVRVERFLLIGGRGSTFAGSVTANIGWYVVHLPPANILGFFGGNNKKLPPQQNLTWYT